MINSNHLVNTLKQQFKSRGLTYADIAKYLQISQASVKRIFAEQSFTLHRLEQLCALLEIDFLELAKLSQRKQSQEHTMTEIQEKALAKSPGLLAIFYLCFSRWTFEQILEHYDIDNIQLTKHLTQLDKLELINLYPNNQIKLNVSQHLKLRANGPIESSFGKQALNEFLGVNFEECGGFFNFQYRELSKSSLATLERKVKQLITEFNELAELDSSLQSKQKTSIGLCVGARPWQLNLLTGLQLRPEHRVIDVMGLHKQIKKTS